MDYTRGCINTVIGLIEIEASEDKIISCKFLLDEKPAEKNTASDPLIEEALFQLKAYFKGQLQQFDLPLSFTGTDFQNKVWKQLLEIPFGKTVSYLQVAKALGDVNYVRAVGTANSKNPIGIIVPCHRVIGSGGNLVGYAGGLHRKQWLLDFEGTAISGQMELF